MKKFRPMLAGKADLSKLVYPVLVSPKLDGIRAVVINGVVYSRSMKPIRNEHVQHLFGKDKYEGADGELIVGNPTAPDVYLKSNSGVMSKDGKPDVTFCVFDDIHRGPRHYSEWYFKAVSWWHLSAPNFRLVNHYIVDSEAELIELETGFVAAGYEGAMIRSMDGPYKQGRSTVKEGYLLKLKTFEDSEAEIIGFEELMHNANVAEVDERGYTKRSTAKDNLEGTNTLGSFLVRDIHTGVAFSIGTGFTQEQRSDFWKDKQHCLGCFVKYKFFPGGMKDKPRFPVFLGFRDQEDMS